MGLREVHTDGVEERFFAVDERGTGLRATWRPAHGFVNLSVWRGQYCVETFHLSPVESGNLIGFLATALTAAVPPPSSLPLRLVDDGDEPAIGVTTGVVPGLRQRLAARLDDAARRLRS